MWHESAKVSEMVDDNGQWLWGAIADLLPCDILLRIVAVKPPVTGLTKDFPRWLSSLNDQFTVSFAYMLRAGMSIGSVEPCWAVIARYKGLPRIRTFLCRIFTPEEVRWEPILVQGWWLQQECIAANRSVVREIAQPVHSSRGEVRWQCPPVGWHKLNTDGAVCGASGMASCGGILRTDVGGWMIGFSKRIGICSALAAKL
ncbi:hypothetical protein V6N11_079403 [Hibiscus sabdariffa]|uniref:RNase H type-1 domain-containing protein n=1 Tax=Hibiscus sabdariffa TaxID=183260 RepID=A0ABR2RVU8_9ROSI